jgi:retron-type reverse transcriptase
MPHIQYIHAYEDIISLDNLLGAWKEFVRGKRGRSDVQDFQLHLFDNLDSLHEDLEKKIYQHGGYESFKVNDPKPRDIHKACVRDRVLHRALYRTLYPFFDCLFTTDSFSCRNDKGTHKAMDRFKAFGYKVSRNRTCTAWVLKGDIRKFFASIDHGVLLNILSHYILDDDIIWLINEIVSSFNSTKAGVGLPLGNLTSQLLTNVYMNEFDQFIKHELKMKYYIRYADDFVVMSNNRDQLAEIIRKLQEYLSDNLKLTIHPDKIYIKTIASGVDYLGWVHFPDHRVLRTSTKRRMFRNLKEKKGKVETVQSYLGLLKHGNAHKLQERIRVISSGKIL